MNRVLPTSLSITACFVALAATARADALSFTLGTPLDIQALGITSIGDLAFDRGTSRLWICDGANGGQLYKLNPTTGAALGTIDPSVVPGLDAGPACRDLPCRLSR